MICSLLMPILGLCSACILAYFEKKRLFLFILGVCVGINIFLIIDRVRDINDVIKVDSKHIVNANNSLRVDSTAVENKNHLEIRNKENK